MADIAYTSLSQAQKDFKDFVWIPMLAVGQLTLESKLPFLAFPIIKQSYRLIVGLIADWTFKQLIEFIDVTAIRFTNARHESAFNAATESLAVIADQLGTDSEEYKNARIKAITELAVFTHIGPK